MLAAVADEDVAPLDPAVLGSVTPFVDRVVVVCALVLLKPRVVVKPSVTALCVLVFTAVLVLASLDDGVVDGMVTLPSLPPVLGVVAVVVCLAVELVDGGVSVVVVVGGVVDGGVSVVVVGGGVVDGGVSAVVVGGGVVG